MKGKDPRRERLLRRSWDANDNFMNDIKDGWIKEAIDHVKKEENEINKVNSTGLTPLLLALHGDHVDLVKALLDRGADTNIRDRSGYTALHRTSQTNKDEMMTMLINAGANIEITDNSGRTPLHVASNLGKEKAVSILISAGANVEASTPDGYRPIHYACWNGRLSVARALYNAGASINSSTTFGSTPLHKAIEKRRIEVIKWLIFKGANVSAVNKGDAYPLDGLKYEDRSQILNDDSYPLHALIANRSSLWLQIVIFAGKTGDTGRLRVYLARYPQLAYVKDPRGVAVLDMLDSQAKKQFINLLHWHGRYRLLENLPIYWNNNTLVLCAIDQKEVDESGNPRHVALKLMLNKERFRREMDVRAANLKDEYILNVVANYPSYTPDVMSSRFGVGTNRAKSRHNSVFIKSGEEHGGFTVSSGSSTPQSGFGSPMSPTQLLRRLSGTLSIGPSLDMTLHGSPAIVPLNLSKIMSRDGGGCSLSKEEAESMYCLVMPLAERNLYTAMKHDQHFGGGLTISEKIKEMFIQLVHCVSHLHDASLIHCDIKPMNIVLSSGRWKLIDLDCAVLTDDSLITRPTYSTAFFPPESLYIDKDKDQVCLRIGKEGKEGTVRNSLLANPSFDIWSLGCVLYQLCNDDFRPLFVGNQRDELSFQRYLYDSATNLVEDSNSLWALCKWTDEVKAMKLTRVYDPIARHLLANMLHLDDTKRPSLQEILLHPFLAGESALKRELSTYAIGQDEIATNNETYNVSTDMNAHELSPLKEGTSSRVDVHRALYLAQTEENTSLITSLEESKRREENLTNEVERLRFQLGKFLLADFMSDDEHSKKKRFEEISLITAVGMNR